MLRSAAVSGSNKTIRLNGNGVEWNRLNLAAAWIGDAEEAGAQ